MAGYNTRDFLENKSDVVTAISGTFGPFKIAESDATSLIVQINAAADPVFSLQTSLDGGLTWNTATASATTAFSGGKTTKEYIYGGFDSGSSKMLAPLAQIVWGATTTVSAIWVTRRT